MNYALHSHSPTLLQASSCQLPRGNGEGQCVYTFIASLAGAVLMRCETHIDVKSIEFALNTIL